MFWLHFNEIKKKTLTVYCLLESNILKDFSRYQRYESGNSVSRQLLFQVVFWSSVGVEQRLKNFNLSVLRKKYSVEVFFSFFYESNAKNLFNLWYSDWEYEAYGAWTQSIHFNFWLYFECWWRVMCEKSAIIYNSMKCSTFNHWIVSVIQFEKFIEYKFWMDFGDHFIRMLIMKWN